MEPDQPMGQTKCLPGLNPPSKLGDRAPGTRCHSAAARSRRL